MSNLRERLQDELNIACAENGSDTPDFVLAQYLMDCLAAFDKAANARDQFHGRLRERERELLVAKEGA